MDTRELINWYGMYKACGDQQAIQDILYKLNCTRGEADELLVRLRGREASKQDLMIRWHIFVWAPDAEPSETHQHEFIILDWLTADEAYKTTEQLIGEIQWGQPFMMGDGNPYIPLYKPVGAVRKFPDYPPPCRPFSAEILQPDDKIGACMCPESLGCFETRAEAEKAIRDRGIQIVSIQDFDRRADAF